MKVKVKTYTGDRALQRGINSMLKKGYVVQGQTSMPGRKSLLWARRQRHHTVTFQKLEAGVGT